MIDRNNTINYLKYLLTNEQNDLKNYDNKNKEIVNIKSKINLLENIIFSIKQMPEIEEVKKQIPKKIKQYDGKPIDYTKTKVVLQYDLNGNFIKEWKSMIDVVNELGISQPSISNNIAGRIKHAGGFIWKFKNM